MRDQGCSTTTSCDSLTSCRVAAPPDREKGWPSSRYLLLLLVLASGLRLWEITHTEVISRDITEWDEVTGRLEAVNTVAVRPRVSGFVSAVRFQEGAIVHHGDLLFQIDPRPFEAEADRLRAELARARATVQRATSELQRAGRLAGENAMSHEEQERRAGFARALVLDPAIVMFDEPDSGLDPVRTALLGELILEIHRDMMDEAKEKQKAHLPTFCVITHDIMSARRVADYINVLWKGRIVEAGPAEDMLNSDNPFIRQFLSGESQGPLTMD